MARVHEWKGKEYAKSAMRGQISTIDALSMFVVFVILVLLSFHFMHRAAQDWQQFLEKEREFALLTALESAVFSPYLTTNLSILQDPGTISPYALEKLSKTDYNDVKELYRLPPNANFTISVMSLETYKIFFRYGGLCLGERLRARRVLVYNGTRVLATLDLCFMGPAWAG